METFERTGERFIGVVADFFGRILEETLPVVWMITAIAGIITLAQVIRYVFTGGVP